MNKRKAQYIDSHEWWIDCLTLRLLWGLCQYDRELQKIIDRQNSFFVELLKTRQNTFKMVPQWVLKSFVKEHPNRYMQSK